MAIKLSLAETPGDLPSGRYSSVAFCPQAGVKKPIAMVVMKYIALIFFTGGAFRIGGDKPLPCYLISYFYHQ